MFNGNIQLRNKSAVRSSNEELMNILLATERYIELRPALCQELSNGFFRLSQSRSNRSARVNDTNDVRFDLDPTIFLDEDFSLNDSVDLQIEDKASSIPTDSIYLISAMPPPSLRKAQKHFRESLFLLVQQSKEIQNIQKGIASLDHLKELNVQEEAE